MNVPLKLESVDSLKKEFEEGFDLIEKAVTARKLWQDFSMTFAEIDAFVGVSPGWCGSNIWMSSLSDELKKAVRSGVVAKSVAKLLAYLFPEDQDLMVKAIRDDSRLSLKESTGIFTFIKSRIPNYDDLMKQVNKRRVTVSIVAIDSPPNGGVKQEQVKFFGLPRKIKVEHLPWHLHSIAEFLTFIESLPLEDLGERDLPPKEILLLREVMQESALSAARVAERLRGAWKKRLVTIAPEGAMEVD